MKRSVLVLVAVAFAAAAPAAAQEWQVARQNFAFAGTRLTVRVDADQPGSLRVIRGAPGGVRVAARAARGFTDAGLSEDAALTLTAAGPGPVAFVVAVPEDVWIEVRLPGQTFARVIGNGRPGRSFSWGEPAPTGEAGATGESAPTGESAEPAAMPAPAGMVPPGATGDWLAPAPVDRFDTPLFTTYIGTPTPHVVSLPDLATVRSVTVRVQGAEFRVATGRPLSVKPGDPDLLEIRPAGPPMDVVLVVPSTTRDFDLRAGATTALRIRDGHIATLCSPVTRQRLSDGREWVTFSPVDGQLTCTATDDRRHNG